MHFVLNLLAMVIALRYHGRADPFCSDLEKPQEEGVCVVVDGNTLRVPCGPHAERSGVHFAYSQRRPEQFFPVQLSNYEIDTHLILNVTRNDANSLVECRVNISSEVYFYQLNITYAPEVAPFKATPNVVWGQPLTVSCPLQANPPAHYTWHHYTSIDKQEELQLNGDLQFLQGSQHQTWKVIEWKIEYNGYYVCCARNALGETCSDDVINLFLSVESCDIALRSVGAITVAGGVTEFLPSSRVQLSCTYTNLNMMRQPPIWYHYDNRSYSRLHLLDEYDEKEDFDDDSCMWRSVLTIKQLTQQQTGTYVCIHSTNSVNTTISLQRCYTNSLIDYNVQIMPSNKTSYSEGSHVIVTCIVSSAEPDHPPQWCKTVGSACTSVQGLPGVHQNLTTFNTNNCTWVSQLEIPDFDTSQTGQYFCYVSNTSVQQNITLQVTRVPLSNGLIGVAAASVVSVFILAVVGTIILVYTISQCRRVTPYTYAKEPPCTGFKWDIFLSYHREQEEFVLGQIKKPLEMHNPPYHICWHHVDFLPGRTILDNINGAVNESRKVVLVFSKGFSQSQHCMAELNQTLDRLQESRTRCMVPVVLEEDSVPQLLRSRITYWPVVKTDEDFVNKLISHIGPPSAKSEPPIPYALQILE